MFHVKQRPAVSRETRMVAVLYGDRRPRRGIRGYSLLVDRVQDGFRFSAPGTAGYADGYAAAEAAEFFVMCMSAANMRHRYRTSSGRRIGGLERRLASSAPARSVARIFRLVVPSCDQRQLRRAGSAGFNKNTE